MCYYNSLQLDRLIKNYDNESLQSTIAWLLQFSTTVITIYDRCYNSRRMLLQFTTGITENSRPYYNSRQTETGVFKESKYPEWDEKILLPCIEALRFSEYCVNYWISAVKSFTLLYVFN